MLRSSRHAGSPELGIPDDVVHQRGLPRPVRAGGVLPGQRVLLRRLGRSGQTHHRDTEGPRGRSPRVRCPAVARPTRLSAGAAARAWPVDETPGAADATNAPIRSSVPRTRHPLTRLLG